MSEYCSKCSPFEGEYEIGLHILATEVKPFHSINFLFEGCENRVIYKFFIMQSKFFKPGGNK
jgi:hypothetical protein